MLQATKIGSPIGDALNYQYSWEFVEVIVIYQIQGRGVYILLENKEKSWTILDMPTLIL
jgi:hypothetical protein